MTRTSILHRTVLALVASALLVLGGTRPAVAADLSDAELADKVASASTVADHEALAAHFRGEAEANAARVTYHERMLRRLSSIAGKPSVSWHGHCRVLIQSYRAAAKEAEALAQEHDRLAQEAAQ